MNMPKCRRKLLQLDENAHMFMHCPKYIENNSIVKHSLKKTYVEHPNKFLTLKEYILDLRVYVECLVQSIDLQWKTEGISHLQPNMFLVTFEKFRTTSISV